MKLWKTRDCDINVTGLLWSVDPTGYRDEEVFFFLRGLLMSLRNEKLQPVLAKIERNVSSDNKLTMSVKLYVEDIKDICKKRQ